ncbi:MAG: hypothetical protein QM632_02855 [Micrococcaceae bacterium]
MKQKDDNKAARAWVFTIWAERYSAEKIMQLLPAEHYCAFMQLEKAPETGKSHWQGYVRGNSAIKGRTLRNKFPKEFFEPANGAIEDNWEYSRKEKTYLSPKNTKPDDENYGDNRHVWGFSEYDISGKPIFDEKKQGFRTDLAEIEKKVFEEDLDFNEILLSMSGASKYERNIKVLVAARDEKKGQEYNKKPKVIYIYGKPGTGKTSYVLKRHKAKDVFRQTVGPNSRPLDGYKREKIVMFDEFNDRHFSLETLNGICDEHPMSFEVRFIKVWKLWDTVYIVSNFPFTKLYREAPVEQRGTIQRRIDKVLEFKSLNEIIEYNVVENDSLFMLERVDNQSNGQGTLEVF